MPLAIRPSYRNAAFIGFHLEAGGEPIGWVFGAYKHAALALESLR